MLVNKVKFNNINKIKSSKINEHTKSMPLQKDSVRISAINEPNILTKKGKETRVLSFAGINNPFRTEVPKIRFGPDEINRAAVQEIINKDYENGYKLKFKLIENGERKIEIFLPIKEYNLLPLPEERHFGYAPNAIVDNFYDDIKKTPQDFKISVFRTFKNSKFAILNLDYVGKDKILAKKVSKTIDNLFSEEKLRLIEEEDTRQEIYQVVYKPDTPFVPTPKKIKPAKEIKKTAMQESRDKNLLGIRTGIEDTWEFEQNIQQLINSGAKKGMKLKFRAIEDYNPKYLQRDNNKSVEIYYEPQDLEELPFKEHQNKVIGHMAKSYVREFYDEVKENPQDFEIVLDTLYKIQKKKRLKNKNKEVSQEYLNKIKGEKTHALLNGIINAKETGKTPEVLHKEQQENAIGAILGGIVNSKVKTEETGKIPKRKPNYRLEVDLNYIGKDSIKQEKIREKVSNIIYKNQITPQEILEKIFDYKKVLHGNVEGTKMIQETRKAIKEIVKVLQNKDNKKILLIGHDNPDGDTVGSALGLKYALEIYGGKEKIDVAIGDVIKGFVRTIPGTYEIKRTKEFLQRVNIDKYIEENPELGAQERLLLQKTHKDIMENTPLLDKNEKYDVVVMLDIASPKTYNKDFSKYLENAKKVVYIDHHPDSIKKWKLAKDETGFDVEKVKKDNLYWVEKKMPAAAMMTTIIANKLLPKLSKIARGWKPENFYGEENLNNIFRMSSALATGITTDTGGCKRNINTQIEDEKIPKEERPNLQPNGLRTWLFHLTHGDLSKYKLAKQMDFDLPKKSNFLVRTEEDEFLEVEDLSDFEFDMDQIKEESPFYRVIKTAEKNAVNRPDLGLGIIRAYYDDIYDIWKQAALTNDEITLKDAADAYKFNPTVLDFRFSRDFDLPEYTHDKISVVIRQEGKEGKLDTKYSLSNKNRFGFSFRCADQSNHANILGLLFGGGGHDSASGGSLTLEGLTYNTPLAVKIDGKIENDNSKILNVLKHNYDIEKERKYGEEKTIEIIKSPEGQTGRTMEELIFDITKEIRKEQAINKSKK